MADTVHLSGGRLIGPDGELQPDAIGVDSPKKVVTSTAPFGALVSNVSTREIIGYDAVDGLAFLKSGINIFQSADPTTTLSAGKGFPSGVTTGSTVKKVVRFKGNLYLIGQDSADSLYKIWRAAPAAGDTAFSWSLVFTHRTDATAIGTALNADASYIYVGEYSGTTGPASGPKIFRSSDGTTWEEVHQIPSSGAKHIHAVTPDPYNPGHVYCTSGDGLDQNILRSTNYGASGSWSVIVASGWQAVQLSFDANWVYCAVDNNTGTLVVLDRATLTPKYATTNYHQNIAVPAAAALGDRFRANAYYGIVDPSTGVYYCTTQNDGGTGNIDGIFFVPGVGSRVELWEKTAAASGEMFIFGGRVWWYGFSKKLLSTATP